MASSWQKMMLFLGLVDEEQVEAEARAEEAAADPEPAEPAPAPVRPVVAARGARPVSGRRVEPPVRARRRISEERSLAEAGVLVQPVAATASGGETEVIVATAFSDAQRLADALRDGLIVVLDLRTTEPEMVRRLVDFSSGLTYALDGTMRKINQGVILVSPPRAVLSTDERNRLADLGLFAG